MLTRIVPLLLLPLVACAKDDTPVRATEPAAAVFEERLTCLDAEKCYVIQNDVPLDIKTDGTAIPRMDRVRIQEYGIHPGHFYARIEWHARGAGTLAIGGPEGTLIATGTILPNGTTFFREVHDEKPLSQLFARGVVFGETDPEKLIQATLKWLNEVVAPEIDRDLARRRTPTLP